MLLGNLHNGIHHTRIAEQVRDNDALCAGAKLRSNRLGRHVERMGIDVSEYGDGRLVEDRR